MSEICCTFAPLKRNIAQIMTTRREKSKPQMNKQLEAANTEQKQEHGAETGTEGEPEARETNK